MKTNIIKLRLPGSLYQRIMTDLKRPHDFAYERVGFIFGVTTTINEYTRLITFNGYQPVDDDDYIKDDSVGACIGSRAIRSAMQRVMDQSCSAFHVHLHNHKGQPKPSGDDIAGLPPVIDSLANIDPDQPHGVLILSKDSFFSWVKVKGEIQLVIPEIISAVRYPMVIQFPSEKKAALNKLLLRQSFLGERSTAIFEHIKVGVVGLGGGGSHLVQQLAHLGIKHFTLFDFDKVEDSNHNRLIGAHFADIKRKLSKTEIARRLILAINPKAEITIVNARWQEATDKLQQCEVAFGGVDTYEDRGQLEAECRRYLIPLIDIGMDVHQTEQGFHISGQVILSMPGQSCMRCLGFINEDKLAMEAAKYGKVGGRPQVVWPNGLLASSAVGIFTDLVTGWSGQQERIVYLAYDGNSGLISNHVRLEYLEPDCDHYTLEQLGPPKFIKL
ncbi:ThiF family adenylyltransferase [Mucilaginibacter pocheonensis]|uniref:THIF-type NAD/FAD binding fold domain-containing protein n=1 Tax=Mucilaginibacter pocheonensis TaxID=398050 RepID=A0ABU1T7S7_9SPHI|nr:ThiF family adenylyltransferase [Mucilaginibacter pocheonensis]MDR6941344.1 hypothetical protein [Mucilaginibacter pocheonensis]